MKKLFCAAIIAMASIATASAQQIILNSGQKGGTYFTMTDQLIAACANDGSVVNVEQAGGSPATITNIVNNKVSGGLVQYDVLWMRRRVQDLTSIKTLVSLHPEQVHVVAQAKGIKQGGWMGIGGKNIQLEQVKDLKGLTVAAQGGSMYSARAINQLAKLDFNIVSDFSGTTAVIEAVKTGKVPAAIFVGGAPMEVITKLDKSLRLLPFDKDTIEKLSGVYREKTIMYENLSTSGVKTVEVDSLLVVNNYKGAKMSGQLNKLRSCLTENIDDLRETAGMHPAWRNVKLDASKWDMYVGKQ